MSSPRRALDDSRDSITHKFQIMGHEGYLHALETVVIPQIRAFKPDLIAVACGYDAACPDPLCSMMATADTYRQMTTRVRDLAREICGGKLVMAHEGGYSEVYVPFCGHAVMEALSGSAHTAEDPLAHVFHTRQPNARLTAFHKSLIDEMAQTLEM